MNYGSYGQRPLQFDRRPIGDPGSLAPSLLRPWNFDRQALTNNLQIALPTLAQVQTQRVKNEDCSFDVEMKFGRLPASLPFAKTVLYAGELAVAAPFAIPMNLDQHDLGRIRQQINSLPNGYYELWPADHNVSSGFHIPDPWGDATHLMTDIEERLPIVRPPVNHNKISSRRVDKFGLDELHLDSFEGMRFDVSGERQPIFRYFVNLGETWRTTAVVTHAPGLTDRLVPLSYTPNYLDPLFEQMNRRIPVVILDIPPPHQKMVFGYKVLTTHMVHGEYGPKADMLAIINSLC